MAGELFMSKTEIERRLGELETEIARLKATIGRSTNAPSRWWEEIAGSFAGDKAHDEAMRLGREYRESLKPKERKRRNGCS